MHGSINIKQMVKTHISAYGVSVPEVISVAGKLRLFEKRERGWGGMKYQEGVENNLALKNYIIFTYY